MIDTHSHLLPFIDHGCPDLETSVLMAREAEASGIHTVVCTPHLTDLNPRSVQPARAVLEEVESTLAHEGIQVRLLLGFEVDLGIAATSDREVLQSLTIEGSDGAILLEMPYQGWPVFMEETIFRLRMAGFLPVLAHPERNDRIQTTPELLSRCLSAGAVAQATVGSLGGEFGRSSERAFSTLLARGYISLLATDAHGFRHQGWTFEPAAAALEDRASADDLTMLTKVNPERLLSGGRPAPVSLTGKAAVAGESWRDRVKFSKRRRTRE
jgi:protein-tyrosine phosphatase